MKTKLITAAVAALIIGSVATSNIASADDAAASIDAKLDDASMIAKIKTNLLRSSEVEGLDVGVDVKDGVVTLSGTAGTPNERASAEKIARTSDGVKRVDNRIVIKADHQADSRPAIPPPAVPAAPGTVPPPPAN